MKSVRRLNRTHAYQLSFTLIGICALVGLLLNLWKAVPAAIATLGLGILLGYGIDRIALANISGVKKTKSRSKRSAQKSRYVPKDGPGRTKPGQTSGESRQPDVPLFLRKVMQWMADLPGQLLTVLVLTSLAFFVFLQLGGQNRLVGAAVTSENAYFCSASVVGVPVGQIDPAKWEEYEYDLTPNTCRDFDDYLDEISKGSDASAEAVHKEVCDLVDEAMLTSLRKITRFDNHQYVITGEAGNLRGYNIDVYTANCAIP